MIQIQYKPTERGINHSYMLDKWLSSHRGEGDILENLEAKLKKIRLDSAAGSPLQELADTGTHTV